MRLPPVGDSSNVRAGQLYKSTKWEGTLVTWRLRRTYLRSGGWSTSWPQRRAPPSSHSRAQSAVSYRCVPEERRRTVTRARRAGTGSGPTKENHEHEDRTRCFRSCTRPSAAVLEFIERVRRLSPEPYSPQRLGLKPLAHAVYSGAPPPLIDHGASRFLRTHCRRPTKERYPETGETRRGTWLRACRRGSGRQWRELAQRIERNRGGVRSTGGR
jgi:hypothetical protein